MRGILVILCALGLLVCGFLTLANLANGHFGLATVCVIGAVAIFATSLLLVSKG